MFSHVGQRCTIGDQCCHICIVLFYSKNGQNSARQGTNVATYVLFYFTLKKAKREIYLYIYSKFYLKKKKKKAKRRLGINFFLLKKKKKLAINLFISHSLRTIAIALPNCCKLLHNVYKLTRQ